MAAVTVGLLCVVGAVVSAPARTFDQRQHGELNIHAQLDNIVILLIPSSNFNLLDLATKTKYLGEKPVIDKGSFLQIFQKPHKVDIDRFGTVDDQEVLAPIDSQNDIKTELTVPAIMSQQVILNHEEKKGEKNEENEQEVVATVEEMKPETTEKVTDLPKSETTEDTPIKQHSTFGETVRESVLKISIPEDIRDALKKAEEQSKEQALSESSEKLPSKEQHSSKTETNSKANEKSEKDSLKKDELLETVKPFPPQDEASEDKQNEGTASEKTKEPTIEDLIRPVAPKEETPTSSSLKNSTTEEARPMNEEPVRLAEGARREKVIRYKPETKWAPQLVDLLGPPKSKELEERQRFASVCSPGSWDTELKTCIMPGETRSRKELARFLEAMRFGIAIPAH